MKKHPPEPYLPRRYAHLDTWREAGHTIKVYGIHHDPDRTGPIISSTVADAARTAVNAVLKEHARGEDSHGLGFCIVHVGQDAVWLLVDWWITSGIMCQRLLSAPLAQPDAFTPASITALACVWELVVITHERNAWVQYMLTAKPDAKGYLEDVLPAGRH